uniref:Prominin 2 n=1 Tax=Monopterus albus TaxID=43700 RepID=A0A3Q3JVW6_MONAL|nr:prominin-1-A-like isoform X2 [Monopterus albus]
MRLCESVRSWRWLGCAGAFRVGVGVMLLGLSLAESVPPQASCAAAPQNLTQPHYQDVTHSDTNVGFMATLVHSFLNTVQPQPFSGDLILQVVDEAVKMQLNQEVIHKILMYKVGFLVCAAIGVVYIILMPTVGSFFACCRCCGKCGGKMYQKQTSSIHCSRRTLYWSAFVTTVIILAGNICMFKSNEALKMSVDQSPEQINKSIDNICTFLTAVPQQVNYVVNESNTVIQAVASNLDAIGHQLGTKIQQQFNGTLAPALHSLRLLDQETLNTSVQLYKLNESLVQLQHSLDSLQANVTAVKNRINQTLSNPDCTGCGNLQTELQSLTLNTSISIPNLNEFQSAVDKVIKINLTSKIKEVENSFNNIPQTVTNETRDLVQSSKQQLGDIKTQISKVTSDIPLSALGNVSNTLNQVKKEIGRVTPQAEKAEYIGWSVGIAICCVVLLVVVCNVLGLLLGPVGLTPRADPRNRSCMADCGGTFLMMGAGFSFLFSWLFMIVVLLLFLVGGNVYTVICQPWNNRQLLKIFDSPNSLPGLDISQTLGLKTNLSIFAIYSDCKQNQPLWTTLHLYELINLEDLLNVSKYTEQIQQQFEKTNLNLSSITLLSPEVENQLRTFSTKATQINTTATAQSMNNISNINLNTTANKLDRAADTKSGNIQQELRNEARDLRQIQTNIETIINPQIKNLNSTIHSLQLITEKITGTVGEVLNNTGKAQDFLNTNTTQIVKTESRKFLNCQLNLLTAYADWANIMITQELGRCGPVAGAVDLVDLVLCSQVVESLNAFWFSLGWCLIFFIPSIIFSIKLAKYYRRMKHSDAYDNQISMANIPWDQMKIS